jgi:ABC-type polysaccharide/polyol phosphate export permease
VVLTFWFWLTPIFFDEQRLPQSLRFDAVEPVGRGGHCLPKVI